jgi:hypothetical protein
MFKNKRYCTSTIVSQVPIQLQIVMWNLIDTMEVEKDYLQIFELSECNGKQKIIHTQEVPEYKREYLFNTGAPFLRCVCEANSKNSQGFDVSESFLNAKIYVIDSVEYSMMLFNYEY